jgi:activating signal cointegrator 1
LKVLSLIQPWATLVATNEKRIETRSWKTNYRGELFIHASKKVDKKFCEQVAGFLGIEFSGSQWYYLQQGVGNLGAIIAKCNLVDCVQMKEEGFIPGFPHTAHAILHNGQRVDGNEYWFGDYTHGRWAWILKDIEPIDPIPAKGKLGLWEFDINQYTGGRNE